MIGQSIQSAAPPERRHPPPRGPRGPFLLKTAMIRNTTPTIINGNNVLNQPLEERLAG
jgi:hypothetical protein